MNTAIQLLAFGQLTETTGQHVLQMEDVVDTDQLRSNLIGLYPSLAEAKYLIAVNMEIIRENVKLNPGDVVALLPPFSGG